MYYTGHNRVVICNLLSLRGLQVPWDIPKNKLTIHLQTDWNWCLFCTSIHPSHITWPENRWWNIQSHQNRSSFLALRLHREWTSVGVAGRWKHRRFVCLLCPFGGGESLLNCFMYLNRSQLPVVPCQLRMNGWFSWLTITILSKWALIPPKKYRQNLNWTFIVFVGLWCKTPGTKPGFFCFTWCDASNNSFVRRNPWIFIQMFQDPRLWSASVTFEPHLKAPGRLRVWCELAECWLMTQHLFTDSGYLLDWILENPIV